MLENDVDDTGDRVGAVQRGGAVLPVAQAMGLPLSPLGLMLAVDTIPDALATLGNVTGDLTATSVVARQSRNDTAPAPDLL